MSSADLARIAAALERIAAAIEADGDPPMPDFTLPESPDDVPVTRPTKYVLSGERPADLVDAAKSDHHVYPAGVGK